MHYPNNFSLFIQFNNCLITRSLVGYGLELSRVVPQIMYHLKRKYLCKTESELKDGLLALDLGYGTRVPSDILVFTIVLCYSVMGPIIIPFGVVYFGLGWLILRNQVRFIIFIEYLIFI